MTTRPAFERPLLLRYPIAYPLTYSDLRVIYLISITSLRNTSAMAGLLEIIAWIYYAMTEPSWIPSQFHPFLHGISGFFVSTGTAGPSYHTNLFQMTLGSLFIVPIICLVIYDITLYVFRLTGSACETFTNALRARQATQPQQSKQPINGNGSTPNGHAPSEKTQ